MVSTRGLKFKFCDGERVLCYEPDPTKAKVLYDSKVVDIIINKDQKGRKAVEYLIHFQGWNSSWDRCVTEEYVLKDTEENRQLQRDLAQKAQLQLMNNNEPFLCRLHWHFIVNKKVTRRFGVPTIFKCIKSVYDNNLVNRGAYLYRRERKKRSHKMSERLTETEHQEPRRRARSGGSRATSATTGSSEDGSSGQHADYDTEEVNTEEDTESSSDYDGESSDDEDSCGGGSQSGVSLRPGVDLDIGGTLKRILEQDFDLINRKSKLVVLPAQPTVISILESWVQHFTTTQLTNIPEKPQRNKANNTMERTVNDVNLCREVADGLRVYFDFTLPHLLLYRQEREQYSSLKSSLSYNEQATNVVVKDEPIENSEISVKDEFEDTEYAHLPPFQEQDLEMDNASKPISSSKRKLRSCRVSSVDESRQLRSYDESKQDGGNLSSSIASTSSRCSSPRGVTRGIIPPVVTSAQVNALLQQSNKWRLMTEVAKQNEQKHALGPSAYYGAVHLTRLFVKLPELLQATDIANEKLKVLLKYLDMFLSYLEMHREWFGEQFYTQVENRVIL